MVQRTRLPRLRFAAILLAALVALPPAIAQPSQPSQPSPPSLTPRQLIDNLGVEVRQILESPKPEKTIKDAEQAVADQITALSRSHEGHPLLTELDMRARTPLMLAVSGGYLQIVQALLADPGVRFSINVPDAAGETAWMMANFAPTVTLAACEPAALTLERSALLPPYVRRMANMMENRGVVVMAILRALEAAGADVTPEAAKSAWLKRCPNTSPELRRAIADAELMPTLIHEAVNRQVAFNDAMRAGFANIPASPPDGMRFIHLPAEDQFSHSAPLMLQVGHLACARMPKPELRGALIWSGNMVIRATIATRAGVVEAVDFDVRSSQRRQDDRRAADYFKAVILRALAGYQCAGDWFFEQEFQFRVN